MFQPVISADGWVLDVPGAAAVDERLVESADVAGLGLPTDVDDALARFASTPDPSGALLIRDVPIGALPPTPATPTTRTDKDLATELALLTIARRLGEPVGYVPEHGGRIVQNIVPTATDADRQTSTSSRSNLMFHTETAFHPHRPHYLLLLCLRGDPTARTTLVSIHDLLDHLAAEVVDVMVEARFRTAVDASFLGGRENVLGPRRPLITGTRTDPTFVFDADLTVGIDDEAETVLAAVRSAIEEIQRGIVLEPGDLLVIDNHLAVHGRSPFAARFDGTDRWLQRTFVVDDLATSAAERRGRVIVTEFGRPDMVAV
jgi:hypothetical protein